MKEIRDGGVAQGDDESRSALFHAVIGKLARRKWNEEAIAALLAKYPNGAAAKYAGRLREAVRLSYAKEAAPAGAPSATPGAASPPPHPQPQPHVLPTIQLRDGQLPRTVVETEHALIAAGVDVFSRAGLLVYPVGEFATAADGGKSLMTRLNAFTPDSFIEPVAELAIFQRYSATSQDLGRHRSAHPIDPHHCAPTGPCSHLPATIRARSCSSGSTCRRSQFRTALPASRPSRRWRR